MHRLSLAAGLMCTSPCPAALAYILIRGIFIWGMLKACQLKPVRRDQGALGGGLALAQATPWTEKPTIAEHKASLP